jgi:hypothetical protein
MPKLPVKQLIYGKRNCLRGHIIKQVLNNMWNLIIGWILLNDEKDTVCSKTLDTLRKNGLADGVVEFKSGRDVTNMWEMFDGPMTGSVGYYNPSSVLLHPLFPR